MKIAYITTAVSAAEEGGWGRYSQGVAQAAKNLGHEVVVLTKQGTHNGTDLDTVYDVLPRCSFHPWVQWKVFWAVMKHCRGCEAIHLMVEPYAPGAGVASWFLRAAFLMTLHGTYAVAPKRWGFHRLFITFALKKAHICTTGSYNTENLARERVKFRECRFIPNGADMSAFYPLPQRQTENYFVTTGALKPRKGQDLGVRALGLLKDEFPNLHYMVIGDPSKQSFVDEMLKIAAELGVDDRVEIRGLVSEAELVKAYNNCLAYVLAARTAAGQFEGFPLVYFEAAACGAPIITTTGFGSEYAVDDGKTGYLIEPDNAQALAAALRKIVGDLAHQKQLSDNSVEWAKKHTWERIVADHIVPMYQDARRVARLPV